MTDKKQKPAEASEFKKILTDCQKPKVSEAKKILLKSLASHIEKNKTIMITSALNIPSSLFQKIRKDLRGKAEMVLVKKSMGIRAIESSKKEGIHEMKKHVEASTAFIFSNEDPYHLAAMLLENKQPAFAKSGQISPEDITIEKGPTDLLPGPAISELGAVGLKVGVEGGKIAVKELKVIVKKGGIISKGVADVLQKLEITPFNVGLKPIAVYDATDKKVYTNILIDKEGFTDQLKEAFSLALNFAVNAGYACKETIAKILERAEREAIALNKLANKNETNPGVK